MAARAGTGGIIEQVLQGLLEGKGWAFTERGEKRTLSNGSSTVAVGWRKRFRSWAFKKAISLACSRTSRFNLAMSRRYWTTACLIAEVWLLISRLASLQTSCLTIKGGEE